MIQAYSYMLGSFPMKREVLYPARRNELKRVYCSIVNLSKRTPFYKVNLNRENQEYTIGVKEAALSLKEKLSNMANPEVCFNSREVVVSDDSVLSASLLDGKSDGLPDTIQIKVISLAEAQINRGKNLLQTSHALPKGEYRFSVKVNDEALSLNYVQKERVENQVVQNNVADYLNQSVPEINAEVEKVEKEYNRIVIASDLSGRYGERRIVFEDAAASEEGIVEFLGLNQMEIAPACARFELNGTEKQTATNTFALENTLQITLYNSSSQPVTITFEPSSERILSAVDSVLESYNTLIRLAQERTINSKEHYSAAKLINEMKSMEGEYSEELTACGIIADEDGMLAIDDFLAAQACKDGGMENLFIRENGFIANLNEKADIIAINPIEYLDKIIVTYPNSNGNTYANPYITSMYSGLLFSSYC